MRLRRPLRLTCLATLCGVWVAGYGAARSDDNSTLLFGQRVIGTSATLAQVRAAALAAYGAGPSPNVEEKMTVTVASPGCLETLVRSRIGDDFSVSADACGAKTAFGRAQGSSWRQNENGWVTAVPDVVANSNFDPRQLWEAVRGDDGVTLAGEVQNPDAYVVAIARAGEPPFWLEFDKTTGLLDRAIITWQSGTPTTLEYGEYKTERFGPVPWRITTKDEHGAGRSVDEVQTYDVARPVAADVAIPSSRGLVSLPSGVDFVSVPVQFTDLHSAIVRVTVQGRGLDFILDTGTSAIVIDSGVSDALGLQPFGQVYAARGAAAAHINVKVQEMDVGGLVLRDVTMERLPFSLQNGAATRFVGLLGYDFLAGGVVKLDYEHGTLTYISPERFEPPAGATVIPLRLDDGVPMVDAIIAGHAAHDMIVDTGSHAPVVFSRFVKGAGLPMPDPKKTRVYHLYYPLSQGNPDGMVDASPVRFGMMRLGDFYFGEMLGYIAFGAPKFEMPESDGLLGADLLTYFDVYFDYPHSKMYLVPNALYKEAGGT